MNFRMCTGACRLASLLAGLAPASPALAAHDGQIWTNGSVTAKLSGNWRVSDEVTARFSDRRNGLYEIESNTLVGYAVDNGVTLWAGYTHNPQYAAGDFTIMEHRTREQVTLDNFAQLGRGSFNGRVRMEQRWRQGVDGMGWRMRPYVKYTLPFRKGGRTALVLSAEPFFNLNRTAFQRASGLDRIRTLIGVSTPITNNVRAEVGYLNQHTFVPDRPDNDDHVLSFSLNLSM